MRCLFLLPCATGVTKCDGLIKKVRQNVVSAGESTKWENRKLQHSFLTITRLGSTTNVVRSQRERTKRWEVFWNLYFLKYVIGSCLLLYRLIIGLLLPFSFPYLFNFWAKNCETSTCVHRGKSLVSLISFALWMLKTRRIRSAKLC